jgi:hypothetical protein
MAEGMGSAVKTHYEELAALTLELRSLEERWKMNNRMVNSLLDERMKIVSQLYSYGLTLDSDGNVMKTGE